MSIALLLTSLPPEAFSIDDAPRRRLSLSAEEAKAKGTHSAEDKNSIRLGNVPIPSSGRMDERPFLSAIVLPYFRANKNASFRDWKPAACLFLPQSVVRVRPTAVAKFPSKLETPVLSRHQKCIPRKSTELQRLTSSMPTFTYSLGFLSAVLLQPRSLPIPHI